MPAKQARKFAMWLTDMSLDDLRIDDIHDDVYANIKNNAAKQGLDPESIHNTREYQHTTMPNITIVEASFYGKDDEQPQA